MFLSDTAIRRPIFTIMAMSALVLFGYLGYRALGINQFPNVDFPTVSVSTILPGASPEVVESAVTDVIENELSSIEGIKHITSTSALGVSQISVEFELGRDIDLAAQDVRDKVALAEAALPNDVEPPVVSKLDISAQPNLWIALMGPDARAIGEYARWTLRPRLQTVEGVGNIFLGGFQEREIRVWIDRERLEGYNLTAGEIVAALQSQNVEVPGGALESGARETVVKIQGEVLSVAAFEDLVVAMREGAPIRLRDIGRVEDGLEPIRGFARWSGEVAIGLGIAPRSGANTVEVSARVRERLEELEASFPEGMTAEIAYDGAEYIERSIADAQLDLLYGAFFAMVVVLLFLRSWRSTLIIGLAIPTSLLGTFAFMSFFGFTINTMTVLALALAVGVVIDDAIVVLENIYRNMEEGKPPVEAAAFGTQEIALAVAATTFSLAAVFLPVAFMEGIVGRFLFQFGVTVAVAILLSLFVALTLTPMLCSRFLRHEERRKNPVFRKVGEWLDWTDRTYRRGLNWSLDNRWKTIGLAALLSIVGLALFIVLPKELTPEVDESGFVVASETPTSASVHYTDEKQRQLEQIILSVPEVGGVFSAVGLFGPVNQGFMFVNLRPAGERDRSQHEIMDELRGRLAAVPGIIAYVSTFGSAFSGGAASEPFQFVITGPELEGLQQYSDALMARLREEVPGITDMRT
ncbi:MAG TPA: efflux RND transporter permease subunit, partial [Gemmatimonadota bacterium]|nr:efflux RND transporter permease subunit [Gemmatimonadota bacterium]